MFYGIIRVIIALDSNVVSPVIGQFEIDLDLVHEDNI